MENKFNIIGTAIHNGKEINIVAPRPSVTFVYEGKELKIDCLENEDPYSAVARYVFELKNEIDKLKKSSIPEGYVVVPKEPSSEKIIEMKDIWWKSKSAHLMKTETALSLYKAMIEAVEKNDE